MIDSDRGVFVAMLTKLSKAISKEGIPAENIGAMFDFLSAYTIDQVASGIHGHALSNWGHRMPAPCDIIKYINGGHITHDMVISAATAASTPFGVLCRIQIGSHDIKIGCGGDYMAMKASAQACIDRLPEWQALAYAGSYTSHQLDCMASHSVNPLNGFYGVTPYRKVPKILMENLEARRLRIEAQPKPEPEPHLSDEQINENLKRLKSLVAGIL